MLSEIAEKIQICVACGTCVGGCLVSRLDKRFRPMRIIHTAVVDVNRLINEPSVWLCSYCYICSERCPKAVEFPDILTRLRNYIAKHGNLPAAYKMLLANISKHGTALELDEFALMEREEYGLPDPSPSQETIKEIKSIINTSGLSVFIREG
ncbi:MAG: 4Fe-4S dicluster domain-containing protein [Candidatus Baldrarchaeia archaeon]